MAYLVGALEELSQVYQPSEEEEEEEAASEDDARSLTLLPIKQVSMIQMSEYESLSIEII